MWGDWAFLLAGFASMNTVAPTTAYSIDPLGSHCGRRGFVQRGAAAAVGAGLFLNRQAAPAAVTGGAYKPSKREVEAFLDQFFGDPEKEKDVREDALFTKSAMRRIDEAPDTLFYDEPKLVEHIDVPAQRAMTAFYDSFLKQVSTGDRSHPPDILDLCSSWVSHLPSRYDAPDRDAKGRVSGLGINEQEMKANRQLTDWKVKDLNKDPRLPYETDSFDYVLLALSIDYLTSPIEVLREVARVLRPGGSLAIVFSNRLFFSKAVAAWAGAGDLDHIYYTAAAILQSGCFTRPHALDISPEPLRGGDPLYAVVASTL